ncbi:hypothetical protein MRBLMS1_005804 [Massilia sp. LMS1-1-1.1]
MKLILKKFFGWYWSLSPVSRESIRIGFCLLAVGVLAVFLKFGLTDDGTIKPWAQKPIETMSSPKLLLFSLQYLVWVFIAAFTIALISGLNHKHNSLLNFFATMATGVFYCSGFSALLIAYYSYSYVPEFVGTLLVYGLCSVGIGFGLCYIFQMLIQGTSSPKMR